MVLREIGWGDMDWIHLVRDRDQSKALVYTVINLWVPINVEEFFSSCATGGFSRRVPLRGVSSVEMLERMLDKHAREALENLSCRIISQLSQMQDGQERVIAYYSKTLNKAERNFCVTRRELLAIVRTLEHFH
jgi:hypothetical protein